jgi:delta-aminolevulinic acid dehydratase/porphobilinogen synthase
LVFCDLSFQFLLKIFNCLKFQDFTQVDDPTDRQEIESMPGVFRMGVQTMMLELEKLAPVGLKSVLLFSVTSLPKVEKNETLNNEDVCSINMTEN